MTRRATDPPPSARLLDLTPARAIRGALVAATGGCRLFDYVGGVRPAAYCEADWARFTRITLGALTDFVGFLEGTAAYRRDHRRAEYGDERDPKTRARLAALSPLRWVHELKRPLLMAYGQRDPRIPPATAARFIAAARETAPVWSIAAADEGHWFERTENRRAFDVLAIQFLRAATR